MKFKAVVFDLDGTLIHSIEDLGDTVNQVLEEKGFPPHPIKAYYSFIGDGANMLVQRALPADKQDKDTLEDCVEIFRLYYQNNWKNKTKPYHGVDFLLDELSQKDVKLAILSNKPHAFTIQCVQGLLDKWSFSVIFGQRDSVPKKPNPAGAIEILNHLNLKAEECIYLGDSAVDMKTGSSANMFTVGALWGYSPIEELQNNGAQALVSEPQQILSYFK